MKDIRDYIGAVKRIRTGKNDALLYRGHPDRTFVIKPSLFRRKSWQRESSIFRMLLASQPEEFINDRTTLERLVRMQHYALPTRLLDLTWNPLAALYFCAREENSQDGEVIVFKLDEAQIKFFDSDTVSCISNLAYLNPSERNKIRMLIKKGATIEEFNSKPVVKRLLQFIKAEKPYFFPEIVPKDLERILFVRPIHSNKRILAQNGAFALFGMESELLENNDLGIQLIRIHIPAAVKGIMLSDLDRLDVNDGTMYPEIENRAKYIARKFLMAPAA